MPTPDRSHRPRNVLFYDSTHPDVALGGFVQNGSITEANFLDILEILLVVEGEPGPLCVQERISNDIVSRTDVALKRGAYDIHSQGSIQVSDEPWIYRLTSYIVTRGQDRFLHEICNRDRKCVISGLSLPESVFRTYGLIFFEAVHIFPREHQSLWNQNNYQQWVTDMDDAAGSSKINSAQNGFLLQPTVQQLFDQYLVSVNPDDGYKIVVFTFDVLGLDGRILDPVCRNPTDPHHVSDQALRWHYRQSVLANVRRGGEPIFEHDFPLETDEIHASPYGQERFELEMAFRLREVV
ncbi:hypothetical protein B9Z19DRAFT_1040158 [Tuber borchii]|uniref:Uncharacterized protein n=1 Tax=Tuber borchii TaxID=42251 RepID=A0A2T7A578_TUBBO|nr:hypothetical protein B9Z19DRAFT_1040158 [Tuber borchii]